MKVSKNRMNLKTYRTIPRQHLPYQICVARVVLNQKYFDWFKEVIFNHRTVSIN